MTHKSKKALLNEADVELKFLYPLLVDPAVLAIPEDAVKNKWYLAPTELDKKAGKKGGYFPDFSIWLQGMLVLVVEAKDPAVATEIGFREACLYARHQNSLYPTNLNPCRYVMASNGVTLLAGYWDQDQPVLNLKVVDLVPGTQASQQLIDFCSIAKLTAHADTYFEKIQIKKGVRPFNLVGGQALLNAKRPLNTFAADLSPVLQRYFSSTNEENYKEIAERAYVSTAEVTEYDKVLEALLKDRTTAKRDTIVEPIRTSKSDEPQLTKAIEKYSDGDHAGGRLQIIQGGVGAGKSLFARRYRGLLEPAGLKNKDFWAFIDFNGSPPSLKGAEPWLCEAFISSFERENASLDIYSADVLKGAFARRIQQRKAAYEMLRTISLEEETRERAKDIAQWQSDPTIFAGGIANYVVGGTGKNLIVVMDNVDKLELENQLDAFQLALWFMERSKAFIILQMRDETYERFKNKPPLDTFRGGIAFHISPPRFVDVVKRRLELGIEYLAERSPAKQEYVLDNGARVVLPTNELGHFLKALYLALFGKRNNVSRVLEALAGRDVRKALEMFVSIVTSGHLSTSAITSTAVGEGGIPIAEHQIIKILMRTDYRFFSDVSGYVSNIFHYDNEWAKPDNFLLTEILFYLIMNRKRRGEIGLEGYFSVRGICDHIQKLGYDPEDIFKGVNYLLHRELIIADNFNFREVGLDDCVKIQASGFMHMRVLCERIEYLYGLIPVIPIADEKVAAKLANFINRESIHGEISATEKARAVEVLFKFLCDEVTRLREKNPFYEAATSGAAYALKMMDSALKRFFDHNARQLNPNQLDLL